MKKVYLFICVVMISVTFSCSGGKKDYLEDDIRLWKDTPIWNFAKSLDRRDTILAARIWEVDGLDVDYREPKFGETLLSWAVQREYLDVVEFLLNHGANTNTHNSVRGESPLMLDCLYNDDNEITVLLLKYGANPNDYIELNRYNENFIPYSPLYNAAANSLEKVKILINAGAEVDGATEPGATALQHAILWGKYDIVLYLLRECKADPRKAYQITIQNDTLWVYDLMELTPHESPDKMKQWNKVMSYLNELNDK